jgi:hypothetical protein
MMVMLTMLKISDNDDDDDDDDDDDKDDDNDGDVQVIRRRVVMPVAVEKDSPPLKVTLTKKHKKDGQFVCVR